MKLHLFIANLKRSKHQKNTGKIKLTGRNLVPVLWICVGSYKSNGKFFLDYLMEEVSFEINLKTGLS